MVFLEQWLATIKPNSPSIATLLLLFNIFLPGVGTILNQCGTGPISGFAIMIGIA